MLEPYFFQFPPNYPPPTPENNFRITGYSRVDIYTLTFWKIDILAIGRDDFVRIVAKTGQSLWRDREHLTSSMLGLGFYKPITINPGPSKMREPTSLEDRLGKHVGDYGIPVAIAIALNNPENIVWFEI